MQKQKEILYFVETFSDKFILVWWTAIALQIWHRESIDFDLFMPNSEELPQRYIYTKNKLLKHIKYKGFENSYQQHSIINNVKFTLFAYTYKIPTAQIIKWRNIYMPSLLHLWAMKLHAIWQRAKRKDYVDLYYIFDKLWAIQIIEYTKGFFREDVNIRSICNQLSYFDDINYEEDVVYMPWFELEDIYIKNSLTKSAIEIFEYFIKKNKKIENEL